MIFDSIQNKENYKNLPLIYKALSFLSQLSPSDFPSSKIILIENDLFCNPVSLTSKAEEDCMYEAHQNYIDLHYIISGIERIATSDISQLTVETAYSKKNDIEFLSGKADGYYDLKPGQFMICFPNDAHKVAIMVDEPTNIKKFVFKITTDSPK